MQEETEKPKEPSSLATIQTKTVSVSLLHFIVRNHRYLL